MAEAYELEDEILPVEQLLIWSESANIAEDLDDSTLGRLANACRQGFSEDKDTMVDWLASVESGMKLAKQVYEQKQYPWPNASNVKLPQISIATLHFAAGAYTEIVKAGEVVQAHMPGLSPLAQAIRAENAEAAQEMAGAQGVDVYERAERVRKFMNWQLMDEIEEWEPDMDRLLHMLPVVGCIHKKTVYSPILGRTKTTICDPQSIVINQGADSVNRAFRISERLPVMSENDLYERKAAGLFLDQDYYCANETEDGKEYHFIEQHRWYDLDGDGYAEPYIVTLEANNWTVARVVARYEADDIQLSGVTADQLQSISPEQMAAIRSNLKVSRIDAINHYTKYEFIPDFEGGYWGLGWSHLMGPLSEATNTLLNQLVDSGTLNNTRPGFMSQHVKLQEGGQLNFKMGEYKRVKAPGVRLSESFYTPPVPEPSQVLFMLLGFLADMGKELSSITDVAMGEAMANTPATTILAMIEQGQKVFSSIHKRVYRALKSEFKKLYRLNYTYLDPNQYARLLNQPADPRVDFNADDFDVIPVASPELSSRGQRRAQAEAMRYLAYDPTGAPVPGVDVTAVARYGYEQIIDDADKFFPEPDPQEQEIARQRQMVKMEAEDLMLQETVKQAMGTTKKLETEIQLNRAEVIETAASTEQKQADAVKKLAEAGEE